VSRRKIVEVALSSQREQSPGDMVTLALELARAELDAIAGLSEDDASDTVGLLARAAAGRLEALRLLIGEEMTISYHGVHGG
jgi:hypothetical protein